MQAHVKHLKRFRNEIFLAFDSQNVFNCQLFCCRRQQHRISIPPKSRLINVGRESLMRSIFCAIMLRVLVCLLLVRNIFANNFTCLSGGSIVAGEICDGIVNCADSSDERVELCSTIICKADQFKCYYGACIDRAMFCNGNADCIDGSDEFNCGKPKNSCE